MIKSSVTHQTWLVLTKYKILSDRVNELKTKAWAELPPSEEIEESISEAEEELSKLKAWIDLNFEAKKLD